MHLKKLGIFTNIARGDSSPKDKVKRQAYNSWTMMFHRCYDATQNRFDLYGGRGISVCPEWRDFTKFLIDMGLPPSKKHSIDRVNGDGNYEKSNCKWATQSEQMLNTSRSHIVEFNGKRQTLIEWAWDTGLQYKALSDRINKLKWPIEKALTTPILNLSIEARRKARGFHGQFIRQTNQDKSKSQSRSR